MPAHRAPAAPPAPLPPPLPGLRPPPESTTAHLGDPVPTFTHGPLTPGEMTALAVLGMLMGAFILSVLLQQAGESRARGAVEAWAEANQFEVIKTAVVKPPRGPFVKRPAWQTVSAVTVRTVQGANRSAWICWGNFFFLYLRTPTVEWDMEAGKRAS